AWRPSIVEKTGDRWHRFDSPCGSLRDQVLASSNLPSDAIASVGLLRGAVPVGVVAVVGCWGWGRLRWVSRC
ncbi:hypothetical protein, partial [Actinomadura luteofluorescens]